MSYIYKMQHGGGILISVKKSDRSEVEKVARTYSNLGFVLYATSGNSRVLREAGLTVETVRKIHEMKHPDDNLAMKEDGITLIESGKIKYVLSTSAKGRDPHRDSVKLRRKAIQLGIVCMTSIDTAMALAKCIRSGFSEDNTELINLTKGIK